ncbi:MAG: monovalent cation/H(+) antiporter subunit G [Canibacter sp.]
MIDQVLDYLAALCVLVAGLLSVAAGIGLLRFRDPLTRLHAATKPQIFGLLMIIAAIALAERSFLTLFSLVPIFVLQSLTAPVSAHMVGRAAYRADHVDRKRLTADELAPVILEAEDLDTQWPIRRAVQTSRPVEIIERVDPGSSEADPQT